jgi:hypothetical protein
LLTSSHGRSGAEPTRMPLSALILKKTPTIMLRRLRLSIPFLAVWPWIERAPGTTRYSFYARFR